MTKNTHVLLAIYSWMIGVALFCAWLMAVDYEIISMLQKILISIQAVSHVMALGVVLAIVQLEALEDTEHDTLSLLSVPSVIALVLGIINLFLLAKGQS